jgi:catechol 2,3-dioxygenase-like lactoylglutathione lyase family enzyme
MKKESSMDYRICGIQQLGIGIPDVEEAWKWYRCRFGMDVSVFREAAEAPYMPVYTGGKVQSRDAVLAVNMRGGSGFEIWQYTSRKTAFPAEPLTIGDLGISAGRIKTDDIERAYTFYKETGTTVLGPLSEDPGGSPTFYVQDPYGNIFQIERADDWFETKGHITGGATGAQIGVSDIDAARSLYSEVLGYDRVVYDTVGTFSDWAGLPGGGEKYRRVLLTTSREPVGPFAPLFGQSRLELVQAIDRRPKKIFEGRFWGDAGFIHLCFDVQGMDALKESIAEGGFPFTVDSGTPFDMGQAAGRFSYCEDPDGTLVEFVETRKLPVMKKLGWYLDLSKRPLGKPLPRFMLKAVGLGRVKGNCD